MTLAGRGNFGLVTWKSVGPVPWSVNCHFDSCRNAKAGPFTSFFGVPRESVVWSSDLSNTASSHGQVIRQFCAEYGTQKTYKNVNFLNELHPYAAVLANPLQVTSQANFHFEERLPWVHVADDLPKPPGSADTTEPL